MGSVLDAAGLNGDIDDVADQAERFRHHVAEEARIGDEGKRSGQPEFIYRLRTATTIHVGQALLVAAVAPHDPPIRTLQRERENVRLGTAHVDDVVTVRGERGSLRPALRRQLLNGTTLD